MTIEVPGSPFRYIQNNVYAPEKNLAHSFAAQHALEIYRKKAIYSLIPKNGCSAMRYSLGIENGFITGPENYRWIHDNLYTFSADQRGLITAGYSFVILRCPYARVASAYLDKIVGNQVDAWALLPIYSTDEKAETLSFKRFVTILKNRGLLRSNIHWRPQSHFLVYSNYSDYFALEDFDTAIKTLKSKLGFEVHETRHLYQHGSDGLEKMEGNYSKTPAHKLAQLRREGKVPSHNALYTADIFDLVSTIFADDVALYQDKIGGDFTVQRPAE